MDLNLMEQVERQCTGRLCVHGSGMPTKTRKYVLIPGFGPDHNLGVFNATLNAVQKSLLERYFLCKEDGLFRPALPVNTKAFKSHRLVSFRDAVVSKIKRLPRLTRTQVVSRYTGAKRKIYEAAELSLLRTPLDEQDSLTTAFVKMEKQDLLKPPRIIIPRKPRYNLELGRYLKHAEKHVYVSINKAFGNHTKATVIKGFNAEVSAAILRAKWDRFADPVAIGLDASKFDMHVSLEALRYEHSYYRSLFPGSKRLNQLLKWQERNRGRAYTPDGHVSYEMRGTRCSGDLNTSLGNCIIMCSLIHAYSAERRCDVELANNGDDCVVFMERANMAQYMAHVDTFFRRYGFALVAEQPAFEFEHLEFCQTRPIQLPSGWRMIRNHNAVLIKDPMCLIPVPTRKTHKMWCYAVGVCGMILNQGCPVQQSFYQCFLRNGVQCTQAFMDHVFHGSTMMTRLSGLPRDAVSSCFGPRLLRVGATAITPAARVSYYYAFGVTPDEQLALESYFQRASFGDVDLHSIHRDQAYEPGLITLTPTPQND